MYPELLPYLCCPACQQPLALIDSKADQSAEIVAGTLSCEPCQRRYPIRAGIVDFLSAPRPPTLAQLTNELAPTAWAYERFWRPRSLTLLSGTPLPYDIELPLITEWALPNQGGLIVDIACSNGLYARTLAKAMPSGAGHVLGIDHAMPMLTEARIRARAAGLRVSYARASAQHVPIGSEQAAAVVIGGSLNEIGDLARCLDEVRRVLAHGGHFVAMSLTTHPRTFERFVQRILAPTGIQVWTTDQLLGQIAAAGLQLEEQRQIGIVLFTRARLSNTHVVH